MQSWKKALGLVTGIIFLVAVLADRIDAVLDLPANLRTVMGVVGVIFSLSDGALLFLAVGLVALLVAASDLWLPYLTQPKPEPKPEIKTRTVKLKDLAREQGLFVDDTVRHTVERGDSSTGTYFPYQDCTQEFNWVCNFTAVMQSTFVLFPAVFSNRPRTDVEVVPHSMFVRAVATNASPRGMTVHVERSDGKETRVEWRAWGRWRE